KARLLRTWCRSCCRRPSSPGQVVARYQGRWFMTEISEFETTVPAAHTVSREEDLEEAASLRLRQSAYLELRRIGCAVEGKVLRLHGYVSSYYLRQMAQAVVQGLKGVETIDNQLGVLPAHITREQVGLA